VPLLNSNVCLSGPIVRLELAIRLKSPKFCHLAIYSFNQGSGVKIRSWRSSRTGSAAPNPPNSMGALVSSSLGFLDDINIIQPHRGVGCGVCTYHLPKVRISRHTVRSYLIHSNKYMDTAFQLLIGIVASDRYWPRLIPNPVTQIVGSG